MPIRRPDLRAVARAHMGIDELRPGQEEAVEHLLAGRDALALQRDQVRPSARTYS